MLLDQRTICFDRRMTGYAGPFTGRSEEGDVHGRVIVEIVSLAGLSVGVEEEVETISFLNTMGQCHEQ